MSLFAEYRYAYSDSPPGQRPQEVDSKAHSTERRPAISISGGLYSEQSNTLVFVCGEGRRTVIRKLFSATAVQDK